MNLINSIRNNVQISTFGEDHEGIKIGLQNFPTSKLFLVCYQDDETGALEFSGRVADVLKIDVRCITVKRKFCFYDILEKIGQIVQSESKSKILVNVSCGDKMITSASICASFVYGLGCFCSNASRELEILPPTKLNYTRIISPTKLKILTCLYQNGGKVDSLDKLCELSQLGKALVSYHIHGTTTEGLLNNGFVEIISIKNKTSIMLTHFGHLFISQNNMLYDAKKSSIASEHKCECCGCLPEECMLSRNERECPNCDLEKCCCWARLLPPPLVSE